MILVTARGKTWRRAELAGRIDFLSPVPLGSTVLGDKSPAPE